MGEEHAKTNNRLKPSRGSLNWGNHQHHSQEIIKTFFLKTCKRRYCFWKTGVSLFLIRKRSFVNFIFILHSRVFSRNCKHGCISFDKYLRTRASFVCFHLLIINKIFMCLRKYFITTISNSFIYWSILLTFVNIF